MRSKRKNNYGRENDKKLILSKQKNKCKAKMCLLEVQIQEELITCIVPVVKFRRPKRVKVLAAGKRSFLKISDKNEYLKWRVIKPPLFLDKPEKLINSKILVTNGKRVAQGKIVRVNMIRGGTVSAPTMDGIARSIPKKSICERTVSPPTVGCAPIDMIGGGTVSPPTIGVLPPVDERKGL